MPRADTRTPAPDVDARDGAVVGRVVAASAPLAAASAAPAGAAASASTADAGVGRAACAGTCVGAGGVAAEEEEEAAEEEAAEEADEAEEEARALAPARPALPFEGSILNRPQAAESVLLPTSLSLSSYLPLLPCTG